jgi:hypothetical protein
MNKQLIQELLTEHILKNLEGNECEFTNRQYKFYARGYSK